MVCDSSAETAQILTGSIDANKCDNTIRVLSKHACPKFNIYSFWNSIINNKWVFGILLMVGGVFFCLFGNKFIYATQIIAGVLVTSFLIVYLCFSFLQVEYSSLEFWLIIGVAVLAGLIVGFFIAKVPKVPELILGLVLGFLFGNFMYHTFLKYIPSNPAVVYWVTIISCVVIAGFISWLFYQHILIIATAFIGAYAFVRGVGFIAGHFPDERQVIDLVDRDEWDQVHAMLNWRVYLYLATIVILSFAGLYVQYKYFYESDEDKKKKENEEKADKEQKDGADTTPLVKKAE